MKSENKISTHDSLQQEGLITISFSDLFIVLAKSIRIIIIIPTILCFGAFIYLFFVAKPVFTSTSKIMSSSQKGQMSSAGNIAAQFGFSIPQNQSEVNWVYTEIIRSRTLARSLLKQKFNTQKLGENKTLLQILMDYDSGNPLGKNKLQVLGTNKLLGMIQTSEDKKTNIVTINVSSNDAKFSADLNNAIIKEVDAHQKKYNKSKVEKAKVFIEQRINSIEKDLIKSEEALKIFRDRNRRIENSPALLLEQERLTREVSVLIGVFTTLKQQLETTKIEEVKDSDYVIIIDHPEIPIHKSKPKRLIALIGTGFFGLIIGFTFAMLREFQRKINPKEKNKFEKALKILKQNLFVLSGKKNF